MSYLPEETPIDPEQPAGPIAPASAFPHGLPGTAPELMPQDPSVLPDLPLFRDYLTPEPEPQERIPHFGHVGILILLCLGSLFSTSLLARSALYFHLFGISTIQQALGDIHYTLGSEGLFYLITFGCSLIVFPILWRKGFFAGIHWRSDVALRLRGALISAAMVCFLLALLNGWLIPSPSDTPIDRLFRMPGAAWILFAFGVTLATFFEELGFRGFLLPALCTACDWTMEHTAGKLPRPLDADGHPQWSLPAMAIGSLLTSLPFALMHADQTGYAVGPFLLLLTVSLVLCITRLATRSLAASVLVHASYNFFLFALMMVGTHGFRHLEHM